MTEIYTTPITQTIAPPDLIPSLIGFRMRPSVVDRDIIVRHRGLLDA